jgi:signal transduction histidine kinase
MSQPVKSTSAIEDVLIHRLAIEMAGTLSLEDFRREVSRQIAYILECTRCTFYQLTPDGEHFWVPLFDIRKPEEFEEVRYLSEFIPAFEMAFNRHVPMVIPYRKYENQLITSDQIKFLQTLLVCPLISKGEMQGVLLFESLIPDAYTIAEVRLGVAIAELVSASMDRWQMATDLKIRNKELERSNQELDQFAYVASHDLMSPLRGIDHISSWIEQDCKGILPDKSKIHLQKLRQRVARMEALLKSILEYSRAGRMESKPENLNVRSLLHNIILTLNIPNGFKVEVSSAIVTEIFAAKAALVRVFQNLISNAIKHHDKPEGTIVISWRMLKGFHEFSVKDDGPGIDPKFHDTVFEMFRTLRPRDEVEGSGMGLTLIKKTIEYYGGKIRIESKLGEGTTFIFTWPYRHLAEAESVDKDA